MNTVQLEKLKTKSFLIGAEDEELRLFKSRTGIKIISESYATEAGIFRVCHMIYQECH